MKNVTLLIGALLLSLSAFANTVTVSLSENISQEIKFMPGQDNGSYESYASHIQSSSIEKYPSFPEEGRYNNNEESLERRLAITPYGNGADVDLHTIGFDANDELQGQDKITSLSLKAANGNNVQNVSFDSKETAKFLKAFISNDLRYKDIMDKPSEIKINKLNVIEPLRCVSVNVGNISCKVKYSYSATLKYNSED